MEAKPDDRIDNEDFQSFFRPSRQQKNFYYATSNFVIKYVIQFKNATRRTTS